MLKNRKIKKAVFPVAGLGTRFLPATKAVPKEMMPVLDKPLIEYAIMEAKEAGIEEFIFISSEDKEPIFKHFSAAPKLEKALEKASKHQLLNKVRESTLPKERVYMVMQNEALGLGHAVWCAKDLIGNEPFAVLLPDDLFFNEQGPSCLKQLVDVFGDIGGNIAAVMDISREYTYKYGILDIEKDEDELVKAKGLVEKPAPEIAPSNVAITGRYILTPEIFSFLDKKITGSGGEIQLTDAIASTLEQVPFHGLRFMGHRFDCGALDGWLEANIYLAFKRQDTAPIITDIMEKLRGNVSK